MKNLYVECTNAKDKSVHLSCDDSICISVHTRVDEDSVKVGVILVTFTEGGVCEVILQDEDGQLIGRTEVDVALREEELAQGRE